ncbi:hypothetical protein [Flavobacterium sp. GT3R68]|uniref:hypothetical protein n=1 Tax=Flavobacterium sp. GT3R68 TaxID=2594437 RepID=UPI000F88BD9B|nr:hypothetical protein [Flavobacterium sp. GT3R68]RTY92375.1 hypothetical protein EKL32_17360 [Flavobacterium sp. GSN2]TRW92289.1 hypothetical protein FNW07_04575 [Flavobacterium sp. GT3R68]
MTPIKSPHTFHIPVMGLSYTIDSPIRVAKYGISSVISIIDDDLIEKMNAFYSKKFNYPYHEITQKIHDYRAKRITSYLNLVDIIVKEKFGRFKTELSESKTSLEQYVAMLPTKSGIKQKLQDILDNGYSFKDQVVRFMEENLYPGEIDVNIMTKVDKDNFDKNEQLPIEFNDAHASLRGFANSTLSSSVVLSAGMNPRLYSYFENFDDFFPDAENHLKKKIIIKVSDYRSAMIQGNFLAKKGLWVSEYRIESGLNCGGHAFATEGFLLGPIMEEFKQKKGQLIQEAHVLMVKALKQKGMPVPDLPLALKITVQGGVGTSEEHEFLLNHYEADSVGWGSPFLLVPEATSLDDDTRALLANAKEDDFYTSNISPLGVPFNTVKGTTNDIWKQKRIDQNKAGSSCPKKFLALSKEFSNKGMCTASKKYQDIKLEELNQQKDSLTEVDFQKNREKITEKSCLCVGLANASLIENNLPIKGESQGVVICPGPNLAYFNQIITLSDMVKHIYGNANVLPVGYRPNMFLKELQMYVDYFKGQISAASAESPAVQLKKLQAFKCNLIDGITYYKKLLSETPFFEHTKNQIQSQLQYHNTILNTILIPEKVLA